MRRAEKRLNVKYVVCVIMAILLASFVLSVNGAGDEFSVSSSKFYVDIVSGGGSRAFELYVTNKGSSVKTITVSVWDKYAYPEEGSQWADPTWISDINPSFIELQPGQSLLSNVVVTIPEELADGKYVTWLKVRDDPNTLDKPITIIIRKGSAVPVYKYGISPSSYRLLVTGKPATALVDDPNDKSIPPLTVLSESGTETTYVAVAESTGRDITISKDSGIPHTEDEVGKTFKSLSNAQSSSWFKAYALVGSWNSDEIWVGEKAKGTMMTSPLRVSPYGTGYIGWEITVPDDIPDGRYCMAVRLRPAEKLEGASYVGIEYLSYLLITVDRSGSSGLSFSMWYPVGALGVVVLAGLAYFVWSNRKSGASIPEYKSVRR